MEESNWLGTTTTLCRGKKFKSNVQNLFTYSLSLFIKLLINLWLRASLVLMSSSNFLWLGLKIIIANMSLFVCYAKYLITLAWQEGCKTTKWTVESCLSGLGWQFFFFLNFGIPYFLCFYFNLYINAVS